MSFAIGGVTIYGYGLAVAMAAALSLGLAGWTFRKAGLRAGTLSWFALLAVPLGLVGARLLYARMYWEMITWGGLDGLWRLPGGGFMLYGALVGSLLAAWLAAKITGQKAAPLLDALAAPAALMIALCRLAEGLAGQGYGWYVTDWFNPETPMSLFHPENISWVQRFPFAVQDMYEEWAWAVFVLEALLALVLLALVWRAGKRPGWKALLFLLIYAAGQIWCEAMREDAVVRWGFVRANQVFGAATVAAVLAICWAKLPGKGHGARVFRGWLGVLSGAGIVIAMEFAVEQKIPFLRWMTTDLCFVVLGLGCLLMILSVLPVWRRSGQAE